MEQIKNKILYAVQRMKQGMNSLSQKARIALISAGVIILLAIIGVFAYNSTPGDALYGLKVYVAENILSALQVTQQQQFNYGVTLLEARLEELKTMAVNGELTKERLAEFDTQFEAQVQKIDGLLNSEDTPFNAKEVFDTTNHMVAIIKASEQIMDHSTEEGASDRFEALYDTAVAIHQAQIERIVAESTPEEMIAIIQDKLTLITEGLEGQNRNTQLAVQEFLLDASVSIQAQNFGAALDSVGSAVQLLEVQSQVNLTQG